MTCQHQRLDHARLTCSDCGMTLEQIHRDRWIPTTERLPRQAYTDDNGSYAFPVLGYYEGDIEKGFITEDGKWSDYYHHTDLQYRDGSWRLTHWRELPDPPPKEVMLTEPA